MGRGCSAPSDASGQTHHAGLLESWLRLGKLKFSCGNSGRLEQHCPAALGFRGSSELMALVFMVQSRSLSCSHPTGTPAQFWEDPSRTGRCVPVSHPAPRAAEGGFHRGMEMLRCCGLNYWGLGLWGTGLSHAGRTPASSLGHAMGLAMVAWPMSPSLPAAGSPLLSCCSPNGCTEEQSTGSTDLTLR